MSYYFDCQCDACKKREGENLGMNIIIHSIILKGMPENVVSHADYQALEERHAADVQGLTYELDTVKGQKDLLEAELASLRVKVGELVAADREFDESREAEFQASNWLELHNIQKASDERRRLALEALS